MAPAALATLRGPAREDESPMQSAAYTFTGPDMARFWSKIDRTSDAGCWLWQASVRPDGYGQLWHRDAQRPIVAHRWAYLALVGPIPEGLELDHLCRNRTCVNPAHLEPVTTRENLRRGVGFGGTNARKTHCYRGHPLDGENVVMTWAGDHWTRTCIECRRQRQREYFANNPEQREKRAQRARAWRQARQNTTRRSERAAD